MYENTEFPYIKLNVKMKTHEKAVLPVWTGSTVRGALGTELLSALCNKENTDYRCHDCEEKCSAGILFAAGSSEISEERVSPYIVSAYENSFDGEVISFSLTLFCDGTDAADDVIKILKNGLSLGASRYAFTLESLSDGITGDVLYDGLFMIKPEVHFFSPAAERAERLLVEYITPYKTRVSAAGFGFEQLVRAMLRRVSTLFRQNGTEPDFDYQLLLKKAAEVKLRYEDIRFDRKERYSNRSASKMEISGFTGMMVFEGDISPFMPLIRITEIIHAGKMCSMGLGEIKACIL